MKALTVGETVQFTKTVGESDVYLFAGITGDLSPNHVNEELMKSTRYGGRIAHGALIVGYMSTASTIMGDRHRERCPGVMRVSYGYDRVRFTGAVRIGDTVTITYTISRIDPDEAKIYADVTATNQRGDVVAVATHIVKVLN